MQQLDRYIDNLALLETQMDASRERLEFVAEVLNPLRQASSKLNKLASDAKELDKLVSALKDVALALSYFPPTKTVADGVRRIVDFIENNTDLILERLENNKTAISIYNGALQTLYAGVKLAVLDAQNDSEDIRAAKASLLETQAALDRNPSGLSPEARVALEKMELALANLNDRFPTQAVAEYANATRSLQDRLQPYENTGRILADVEQGFDAVLSKVGFLSGPAELLSKALSPLTWVLEKADAVIDAVLGPVIDPIMENLGIQDLIDRIGDTVSGLLPQVSILNPFDGFDVDLAAILGSSPDFNQPMMNRITDARGEVDDVIPDNTLSGSLVARLFGESGLIAPVLGDGTDLADVLMGRNDSIITFSDLDGGAEDDVIATARGNDTVRGGAGNDILINGPGDDQFWGGADHDTLYVNAPLTEFSFLFVFETGAGGATEDVLYLEHLADGDGNFGRDRIVGIEDLVFGASLVTFETLKTARRVNYDNNNEVTGGSGGDLIIGGDLADLLRGLGGNDIFFGLGGFDTIEGGSGFDVVDYSGDPFAGNTGAQVRLDSAQAGARTDNLTGIENVVGSQRGDLMQGDGSANALVGGGGDDTLVGAGNNDLLRGDDGDDRLSGGPGNDSIEGGAGRDTVIGGTGADRFIGSLDASSLDTLFYGPGRAEFTGRTGLSASAFDPGAIALMPQSIAVAFVREADGTVVKSRPGASAETDNFAMMPHVVGTEAADSFAMVTRFVVAEGAGGDDRFVGGPDNLRDLLPFDPDLRAPLAFGGTGNDVLESRTMDESFVGGAGDDTYLLVEPATAPAGVTDTVDDNFVSWFFGGAAPALDGNVDNMAGWSSLDAAQKAALEDTGRDTLDLRQNDRYWFMDLAAGEVVSRQFIDKNGLRFDDDSDNRLRIVGVDVFHGSDRNEWVVLGAQDVAYFGHGGDDTVIPNYSFAPGDMTIDAGDGNDAIHTGMGRDTVAGGDGNDYLRNDGNGGGREQMGGGAGNDLMRIGTSSGYQGGLTDFDGGPGLDAAEFYMGAGSAISIDMAARSYSFAAQTGQLVSVEGVLVRSGTATVTGSGSGDAIQTGNGADSIAAGDGNDVVVSGSGDDTVLGGAGDDLLNPGRGRSSVDGGPGTDTLRLHSVLNWAEGAGLSINDTDTRNTAWIFDLAGRRVTSDGGDEITFNGIERFEGGWGADTMTGTAAGDHLDGHAGHDRIDGAAGDDTLFGGRGDDMIDAGTGDDTVVPGAGFDRAEGGAGDDLLAFVSTLQDLRVDAALGHATGVEIEEIEIAPEVFRDIVHLSVDRYSGFEAHALSDNSDRFFGSAAADRVTGNGGDDILTGLGGGDLLSGGAGDDLIHGDGAGEIPALVLLNQGALRNDRLERQEFSEMPLERMTVEMMVRIDPSDHVHSLMSYAVPGSTNEFLMFTEGPENSLSLFFNGVLTSTTVPGSLFADGALHRLSLTWNSAGAQVAVYVDGVREWSASGVAGAASALTGGGYLIFGQDQDGSTPGRGFDAAQAFSGGIGDIRIFDTIRTDREIAENAIRPLEAPAEGVPGLVANWQVDAGAGRILNPVGPTLDIASAGGFENHSALYGAGAADWITPGAGSDTVHGGAGNDMVSFVDSAAPVIVELAQGTVRTGADLNILHDVENVTGSVFGDFIRGDAGDNRIRALGDYDWIVGSDGSDTIEGGTGRDMISYVDATERVVVDLGAGRGLEGQAAGDTYIGVERVTGSIHADLFYGDDGENDFRGLGGYDWFVGSGGGKDRYDGGSGLDMVSYAASTSGVVASLLLGRGSGGDAARDLYTSIERLTGSNHDDVLTGDNGRNELRGLYGEDRLFGNGGVDRLTGGGSDDYLDGGSGFDYALFSGARSEYSISRAGAATIVDRIASGGDGTDTLVNIEALQFSDGLVFL